MASNDLRSPRRFVTTHNANGLSVFASDVAEEPQQQHTKSTVNLALFYATQGFPIDIAKDEDLERFGQLASEPLGITVPNGSTARIVDFPPSETSQMHRTISVNYNFMIEGEVEIILDSGETRVMKPGDVLIQRAINHAWRNPSDTKWARMAAVSLPATGVKSLESGLDGVFSKD